MSQPSQNDLNILGILHYVLGGLTALFSLVPLIYLGLGMLMASGTLPAESTEEAEALRLVSGFFIGGSLVLIVLGMIWALCTLLAGRFLSKRRNYTYCLVIACIECINMPLGTALGIFTIITLSKPEHKATFERTSLRC